MAARAPATKTSDLMRWGIVVAATFVLAVTAGGRFLLGVVFDQVRENFSLSHETLGLVVSLNVLVVGVSQPLVGWLVDRVPARVVAAGGLALISVGMVVTSWSTTLPELIVGYGILVALGLGAVSPVTITPLVAAWFVRRRATALSIVSMGSPLGQLAIVPLLAVLVDTVGWRDSYLIVAGLLFAVGAPLILKLLKDREVNEAQEDAATGCSVTTALGARSFWQLGFGFFVCGFTMSWVMTYFFDYAILHGISRTLAASALSILGGVSILGTIFTGWWADRRRGTLPLAVVYALRGLGFALILLAAGNTPLMLLAMAVIGFSWSSTTPLTSALCADIYGRRALGTIFGLMFAIMPLGSAVGSALTGVLFDRTGGSYTLAIGINIAAGLLAAAAVHGVRVTPIFERARRAESAPALAD